MCIYLISGDAWSLISSYLELLQSKANQVVLCGNVAYKSREQRSPDCGPWEPADGAESEHNTMREGSRLSAAMLLQAGTWSRSGWQTAACCWAPRVTGGLGCHRWSSGGTCGGHRKSSRFAESGRNPQTTGSCHLPGKAPQTQCCFTVAVALCYT